MNRGESAGGAVVRGGVGGTTKGIGVATGSPYSFLRPASPSTTPVSNRKVSGGTTSVTPIPSSNNGPSSATTASGSLLLLAKGGGGEVTGTTPQTHAVAMGANTVISSNNNNNNNNARTSALMMPTVANTTTTATSTASIGGGSKSLVGYDIVEKAWPYIHAVGRIPNKGSCILISLPNELNTPSNGDPGHHGIIMTTSFVLRSRAEAEEESVIFMETPVSGTLGKWPDFEPITVRLRPDKFYTSSVSEDINASGGGGGDDDDMLLSHADAGDEDDEALGYTVVACNLSSDTNPQQSIAKHNIQPLPLPILVSKIPDISVGDVHLLVTHADGRALTYVVGVVKEVHQHHCVYEHSRLNSSILSSGGPVFNQRGDFVGIQHQCGENSFCVFIRSLVIHLFDSAMLGPCRISLWTDEGDAPASLSKGVYPSYHDTHNVNSVDKNSSHEVNSRLLPHVATTHGGYPHGSATSSSSSAVSSPHLLLGYSSSSASPLYQQKQTLYNAEESEARLQRPQWLARQPLRDVGECGVQLVDLGEFSRFSDWVERRKNMPVTLVPRTVREVWEEWFTDYQSIILLLHAFPYSEQMVYLALQELTSHHNRHNVASVASLGGVGIIVHALDIHPFSERLILAGVTALARLSSTCENKLALARCDGVSVLVALMYEWSSNYVIQQWATYALLNMTQGSSRASECALSLVKAQGVERIIHNMRMYPKGRHLQRWSAQLLVNVLRGGITSGSLEEEEEEESGDGLRGGRPVIVQRGGLYMGVGGGLQSFCDKANKKLNYNCFGDDERGEKERERQGAATYSVRSTTSITDIPPYVLEAWSVVLASVTISDSKGPRADAITGAVSTRVTASPRPQQQSRERNMMTDSTTAAEEGSERTVTIDLLPLLWRLLFCHKSDAFVLVGLAELLKELLCCVPAIVSKKVKLRNASVKSTPPPSPSRGQQQQHIASSVGVVNVGGGIQIDYLYSYDAYMEKCPLFHLPIVFFSSPACLHESNSIYYETILPYIAAGSKTTTMGVDGSDGCEGFYSSPREVEMRRMPTVPVGMVEKSVGKGKISQRTATAPERNTRTPSVLPLFPYHHTDTQTGDNGGTARTRANENLSTQRKSVSSPLPTFGLVFSPSSPSAAKDEPCPWLSPYASNGLYFTNSLDVLVHMLAEHGLRHVRRKRSNAEELAHNEEILRLITGTEATRKDAKNTKELVVVVTPEEKVEEKASEMINKDMRREEKGEEEVVAWGRFDVRDRLTRLILGDYDLAFNRSLYAVGRSREKGGTTTISGGLSSRQSNDDEADRADSGLISNICHSIISLLLEAERCGILRPQAVTPEMISKAMDPTAITGIPPSASPPNGDAQERSSYGEVAAEVVAEEEVPALNASGVMRAGAPFRLGSPPPPPSTTALHNAAGDGLGINNSPLFSSVAVDMVVTLRLPAILIEIGFYHISSSTLHGLILAILALIGCKGLCDPDAYPFLFHRGLLEKDKQGF